MMALILHLMILTSDKIQWELFFCPTPTPLCCARVVPVFVASYDMHCRAVGLFYTQPTGHLWYWHQIKFWIAIFRHLMILTSDKIQWELFFCPTPTPLCCARVVPVFVASYDIHCRAVGLFYTQPTGHLWYWHQIKFCDSYFSASDDINIRQNSMVSFVLHLKI